jgi:ABC-type lipoprotein export system ATPase subunit
MNGPAIDAHDVFRIHGDGPRAVAALRGLTLRVERGEVVVVLGPSGAGKTTLLRLLAAVEQPSAGSIAVAGIDIASLGARAAAAFRAAQLGFVDQHYVRSLSPDLTCRETVSLHLRLLGEEPAVADRRAQELLDRVGLGDRAKARPGALSGGEQQRVAVCAAIAHRPQLLLADEPAGELDAENAALVYRLLGELVRAQGAAALIVSHDRGAADIADRVVALHDGRIVEEERAAGAPALVVSGGWLRIPSALRRAVGEPTRVAAGAEGGELVLTPLDSEPPPATAGMPERDGGAAARTVAALHSVTKRYGERVLLAGVDLEVRAGGLTTLVGRSGTGKTTLLHLLAGLVRPDDGVVEVVGTDVGALDRARLADLRRDHVALVTQEPGLVPYLSAAENVELGRQIRGGASGDARAVLADLGLASVADTRADRLSAGERQRVAVARALAARVELLLVDEPTARLDTENGRLVGALLRRAADERGLAVVCATHDEALVELADVVVRLPAGVGAARGEAALFSGARRVQ